MHSDLFNKFDTLRPCKLVLGSGVVGIEVRQSRHRRQVGKVGGGGRVTLGAGAVDVVTDVGVRGVALVHCLKEAGVPAGSNHPDGGVVTREVDGLYVAQGLDPTLRHGHLE